MTDGVVIIPPPETAGVFLLAQVSAGGRWRTALQGCRVA
ncbi:hypothetical protein BVG79_01960 [Ketogulonicigenium robustum]|uniref:Uncharacterized protein n=1 Tax=Ketogulonicigenium robustum TaxID=92947 RepID=A0A1W6P1B7_9RHOB|nr:hypothetical protein BVG79_01960 [Ketogulonicigenium robustum]